MHTILRTRDLQSIGQLSGQLQVSIRTIESVVSRLRLRGLWRIGGIVHFDGAAVERIVKELAGDRGRRRFTASAEGAR